MDDTYSVVNDGENAWASGIDNILIYRGINNSKYYEMKQKKGDLLSIYAGIEDNTFFFEKGLMTSYTLSPNLAEQFMVGSAENPKKKVEEELL
jgi:hypothetical protein